MKLNFYLSLSVLSLLCSCSTPQGKLDVGKAGLNGNVKSVKYLYYGGDKNEEKAKRLFDEKAPEDDISAEYDKYGRVLKEVFENEDGFGLRNREYVYGDYEVPHTDAVIRNILLEIRTDDDNEGNTTLRYDDNGLLIEKKSGYKKETLYYYTDNLLDSCSYSDCGELLWTYSYKYDKDGVLEQEIKRDSKGIIHTISRYKNGKVVEEESPNKKISYKYDSKGNRVDPNVKYIEFDKHDNWTKMIEYDGNYYRSTGREITYWEDDK